MKAPGAWRPVVDVWGPFTERKLPDDAVIIADERVLRLHPAVKQALRGARVISLRAGEGAKSLRTVERLAASTLDLPRGA
ncbi:MAG: 3-dehydroquinate synthase, partial [Archangium sp.]|nr:3-dehydroquinate synthase [Archangium sp.]